MTVREIVAEYLKEHGYDGLFYNDCGCAVPDLMMLCSGEGSEICEAGFRHETPCADCGLSCGSDADYIVCEHPRKESSPCRK